MELIRVAVSGAGVVLAAAGLYAKRGDIADYALRRAKTKVLRRALTEARLVTSASTIVEVFVPLHSRVERRAAESLELEGHARLHDNGCWVTIDRTPACARATHNGDRQPAQELDGALTEGFEYKKVGVMLMELCPKAQRQITLFEDTIGLERREKLNRSLDAINHRFGRATVAIAASGFEKEWRMNRALLSPRYTTSWEGMVTAK